MPHPAAGSADGSLSVPFFPLLFLFFSCLSFFLMSPSCFIPSAISLLPFLDSINSEMLRPWSLILSLCSSGDGGQRENDFPNLDNVLGGAGTRTKNS